MLHRDLVIERPEIVEDTQQEQPAGDEIQQPGQPLPHVHAMQAEHAQESQQHPGQRVVGRPGMKTHVRLTVHRWNQEQVDQPADAQQSEGEKPDRAGDRLQRGCVPLRLGTRWRPPRTECASFPDLVSSPCR